MRAYCRLSRPFVVGAAAEGSDLPRLLAAHHDRCLRCQATGARARATVRELRGLTMDLSAVQNPAVPAMSRLAAPAAAGAAVVVAALMVGRRLLQPA